jgi:hypothetical protein
MWEKQPLLEEAEEIHEEPQERWSLGPESNPEPCE